MKLPLGLREGEDPLSKSLFFSLFLSKADTRRSQWRKVTREPGSAAAFPVTQRHQVEAKEAETKKNKGNF